MLDAEYVRRRIHSILTTEDAMSLQLDISKLADSTSFSEDLALDSIQVLEFAMAIEQEFGVQMDAKAFQSSLDRVGRLVAYICEHARIPAGGD